MAPSSSVWTSGVHSLVPWRTEMVGPPGAGGTRGPVTRVRGRPASNEKTTAMSTGSLTSGDAPGRVAVRMPTGIVA